MCVHRDANAALSQVVRKAGLPGWAFEPHLVLGYALIGATEQYDVQHENYLILMIQKALCYQLNSTELLI